MFRCTKKRLKITLFAFNVLCALMGVLLIWFGAWLHSNISEVDIDNSETLISTVIIVLGVVLILMSIFGCVATYMESKSMLIGYAVILVVLLVIQIFLVSISYTSASGSLSSGLQKGFEELWDKENTNTNTTLSFYEEWLHCCGKTGADDYYKMDKELPPSCCRFHDCSHILNTYLDGCEKRFFEHFIGSVLACVLVDSIRNFRDRIRFYN